LTYDQYPFLSEIGIDKDNLGCYNGKSWCGSGKYLTSVNPTTGKNICRIKMANEEEYESCIKAMEDIKEKWFEFSMPKRGLIVQEIGERFKKTQI